MVQKTDHVPDVRKEVTAVEWLFNMLWKTPQYETEWQELYKQAKQMEKEQMFEFTKKRHIIGEHSRKFYTEEFEQYYNETYNK